MIDMGWCEHYKEAFLDWVKGAYVLAEPPEASIEKGGHEMPANTSWSGYGFCVAVMCVSSVLAPRSLAVTTLDFEGLADNQPVGNYYNGGAGPNYGVSFSDNALAIIDKDAGGSGNFGHEPSPDTALYYLSGNAATMSVAQGFSTSFSFYYTAISNPGTIVVYDGLDGTGNVLASLHLPMTASDGGDPNGPFSPFVPIGVPFSGIARSVDFGGTANQIGFDNIIFGSAPPQPDPIDPVNPPKEATSYEFVIGVDPSLTIPPVTLGYDVTFALPGVASVDISKSIAFGDNFSPNIPAIEYSFHTNSQKIGKVLSRLAPKEFNLVEASADIGVQGSLGMTAGATMTDGESSVDFSIEATAGVTAYSHVTVDGGIAGWFLDLPVVRDLVPNTWGLEVPLLGMPPYSLDLASIPLGTTFNYLAFKQQVADALGVSSDQLDGLIEEWEVPVTFDDEERAISLAVEASARAYATLGDLEDDSIPDIHGGLDMYFREVTGPSNLPPLSSVANQDWFSLIDMSSNPFGTSDTGTVSVSDDNVCKMTTGSPVWMAMVLTTDGPTDMLMFDIQFDGSDLGEGLLSVYLDDELVALIDERTAGSGLESYLFSLTEPIDPGVYTLSFRMDPYGEDPASVSISNLGTAFADVVPEPATTSLLAFGALAALRRRRKA